MDSEWKIDDYLPVVDKIARFIAYDFPNIEEDELKNEMVVHLLAKRPKKGPDDQILYRTLHRCAKMYALRRRTQDLDKTSQYEYRPSDVRRMLETLFHPDQWDRTYVPDDARSVDVGGDDRIELTADVKWALELLRMGDVLLIKRKYKLRDKLDDKTERACRRAVDRLTIVLNSYARGNYYKQSR